jgi:hypothetical protein
MKLIEIKNKTRKYSHITMQVNSYISSKTDTINSQVCLYVCNQVYFKKVFVSDSIQTKVFSQVYFKIMDQINETN